MAKTPVQDAIALLAEGRDLDALLAKAAMDALMDGLATPAQVGALLMGLRLKGETVDEITAFARAMREHSVRIAPRCDPLLDVCGTGGAPLKTFNISTAAAFVVAGAGVAVAKHGNRSSTALSGSADVLEALGMRLNVSPAQVQDAIETLGIGFLFAPGHHPAMKHAIGPRKELAVRTVFNMLGPLTNPAGANVQLMGVFSPRLVEVFPHVLGQLGVRRALVVHGVDGVDEFSTLGETLVGEWADGQVRQWRVRPEQFGFKATTLEKVKNIEPKASAAQTRTLLGGEIEDERLDIVLLNAGAALYAAGAVTQIEDGIEAARESVRSGAALAKLEALVAHTQAAAPPEGARG